MAEFRRLREVEGFTQCNKVADFAEFQRVSPPFFEVQAFLELSPAPGFSMGVIPAMPRWRENRA
jgi:hypothetical protein